PESFTGLFRMQSICPLVSWRSQTMLGAKMSSAAKLTFLSARLPGFTGRGDKYLGEIAQDLRRVLWKTQNNFAHATCRLPDIAWSEVAVLLVEWAEDIHNDLGLWRSVEAHQRQWFGTPLPFIVAPDRKSLCWIAEPKASARLRHRSLMNLRG